MRLPIYEDVNMINQKIINCKEGDDDDICTIKNSSVYYRKENEIKLGHSCPIDMNNNRIINCREGINENDVCTIKNLQSNMSIIRNELNMRNQRITGFADGMAQNDAVNIKQLNNLSRNTFCYKSGRLNFNRNGISIIYKAEANNVAVGILLILKNDSYVQKPNVTKRIYTLFIPPVTDTSAFNDNEYYFYYWKVNASEKESLPGLHITHREFNNMQQISEEV